MSKARRPAKAGPPAKAVRPAKAARPAKAGRAATGPARPSTRPDNSAPAPRHVVGPVPPLARVVAALALLAALTVAVAAFLPYAEVGREVVTAPPLDRLLALLWPLTVAAAAVSVLAGVLPRLGLAALGATGAVAVGTGIRELYQLGSAGSHRAVEVFLGRRLVTTAVEPRLAVYLLLAAYALLVLALVGTLLVWSRTTMEDAGDFDPLRPRALVLAAVAALAGVLAVVAPTHDAPDDVVVGPSGFRTTMSVPADVTLPERLGLDLAGSAVLALTVFVLALVAVTLRPRLAAVGCLGGLSAYFLGSGLVAVTQAGRYDDLQLGPGGWLALLAGVLFAGVAGWATLARPTAAEPGEVLPGSG